MNFFMKNVEKIGTVLVCAGGSPAASRALELAGYAGRGWTPLSSTTAFTSSVSAVTPRSWVVSLIFLSIARSVLVCAGGSPAASRALELAGYAGRDMGRPLLAVTSGENRFDQGTCQAVLTPETPLDLLVHGRKRPLQRVRLGQQVGAVVHGLIHGVPAPHLPEADGQ